MIEEEARARVAELAPEAVAPLERYARLLIAENASQNLIARSTEPTIWSRHLLDSLQLAAFARSDDASWLDVGSGAGLPGVVLAILGRWHVTMVEPRQRRVAFLRHVVEQLALPNVTVTAGRVEAIAVRHDLVSARAVATIDALLEMTRHCADRRTRFILPKGRSARDDIDLARQRWHGVFHVEQSLTDPAAGIVIADRVTRR